MKHIFLLFIFLFCLQACNVYHAPTSIENAISAGKKVRVTTADKEHYKFKRLEKDNDRLLGITTHGSSTATKLASLPAQKEKELVKIDLSEVSIKEVRLRNGVLSTGLSILTPIAAIVAGAVASDPDFFLSD